jgi:hypothetical protein
MTVLVITYAHNNEINFENMKLCLALTTSKFFEHYWIAKYKLEMSLALFLLFIITILLRVCDL